MSVQEKRMARAKPSMKKTYQYIERVKEEFHKIQWTDGEEVKVYAKVVIATTFVLGMAIYFMDLIIQKTLGGVEMLFKLLFG